MKKIGFVTPWYGENIPGGAEMALRGITSHLSSAGIDLEIITTCVREFTSDWNENYHKPGITIENGISVRRFKIKKRNKKAFDEVNYNLMHDIDIEEEKEYIYINEMINSPELYRYIEDSKNEYALFVFIPYMFGVTYYGIKACPEKSVLIPCFHDERYIYLNIFKNLYPKIAGMIFNAQPECDLANKVYHLSDMNQCVPGLGVDTDLVYDPNRFREKYKMNAPFILYAGRKDSGKNVDTLIKYFSMYKKRQNSNLKLVLIGGGTIKIQTDMKNDILDLGFVPVQDKYDACSAATCLCQPSKNESFSLVIMESWLCKRPVIVHKDCEVTKYFAKTAQGGLYFENYWEFEECVDFYLNNPDKADQMGELGNRYVLENFHWDVVVKKYVEFFKKISY